ncbi:MAG: hypothetical protein IJ429_01850 [Lachnospiraceae bacterium]|nr:hypothetical protein [Lachnospiraceae bacterium]
MNKSVAEREINLFDMLWAVCQKWRSIVAAAVILAVLAGGFSYVKSIKDTKAAENPTVISTEDMYAELTYEEQKTSDVYMSYKKTYEELTYYNENAPLMKLNANDFYKGEVSFYVDNYYIVEYPVIAKEDNTIAVVNAYKATVGTQEFAQKIAEILDDVRKPSYALEMVDCSGVYSGTNILESSEERGVFSVSVYAADEATCEQMKELVKECILARKSEMTKQFGKHEITILQETISQTSSSELLEEQKLNMDMAYNCSNNMFNMSQKFSDAQEKYIETALSETAEVEEATEEETVAATPTISKKLIVLGFLGGAFLMFALWALVYIMSNRLRLEDDFEQIFACKLLGNVPVSGMGKKKWFAFIDGIFEKLRHFNQRYFEEDDALDMVAANIRIAMQKTDAKRVMVTGAVCGDDEKKVAEALTQRLKKDGIEIVNESPVLYNAESLEKLVEIGCVVLVEKAEKSLYQEVAREIEICTQQEVKLLGTVVVY